MRVSRLLVVFFSVGAVIVIAAVVAGTLMSQVEQPTYTVERSDGPIEVRVYPPLIVAEVTTNGTRTAAISDGFKMIAGYIFGANVARQKIEMTAPVMQKQAASDPMGAPTETGLDGDWRVWFIMPRTWTLATLPKPRDPRVSLKAQPAATFAVIRFSGLAGAATIAERTVQLRAFVAKQHIETTGSPTLAFYNPPWTLPFLRRNEIMMELKPS